MNRCSSPISERIAATTSCTSSRSVVKRGISEAYTSARARPSPAAAGLSRSSRSLSTWRIASTRKPSTPRAFQNRKHAEHRLAHVRVAPVEVGLLGQVGVVVALARRLVPLPRPAAEHATQLLGGFPSRQRYQSRLGLSREARDSCEPRVQVRGVVGDEVQHDLDPVLVRGRHQRVEVVHRPERRVDRAVVGDVVAEVAHRRREERRQPDRVDPEPREVREAVGDPAQVADPITVRVLEGARVDLVDDPAPPPSERIRRSRAPSRCPPGRPSSRPRATSGPRAPG